MLTDHLMYLAQVATESNGNNDIVTIVYILTSISLIVGFIIGTYKYIQRQKKKWTDEGITRQKQSQAVQENTQQMMKNTQAIDKLSDKFSDFALGVQKELNGMGERIGRLEIWKQNQQGNRQ